MFLMILEEHPRIENEPYQWSRKCQKSILSCEGRCKCLYKSVYVCVQLNPLMCSVSVCEDKITIQKLYITTYSPAFNTFFLLFFPVLEEGGESSNSVTSSRPPSVPSPLPSSWIQAGAFWKSAFWSLSLPSSFLNKWMCAKRSDSEYLYWSYCPK